MLSENLAIDFFLKPCLPHAGKRCFIHYPADIPFITEIFIGVNTES
jgi:hypothetical protein